jgi:endo-1,4-beta-xylanase
MRERRLLARNLTLDSSFFRSIKLGLVAALCLTAGCDVGSTSSPVGGAGAQNLTAGGAPSMAGGAPSAAGGARAGASGGPSTAAGGPSTAGSGGGAGSSAAVDSLAAKYADYFPIGAAVNAWYLDNESPIMAQDFNHLTAENAMKVSDIHPAENTYDWVEADRIADFARAHGWKMTGHNLLWHQEIPDWMFAGITAGDPASLETLKARLQAHISAVIDRYADVVDNWDVVNEAMSDDPTKTYRDAADGSLWYQAFGSQEYIYWAYKYAHDALETKQAGSSLGKLYYNEYIVTKRVDEILAMFAWLKTKGIQVDGIGFQSHENMVWPAPNDLQIAFDKFVAAGYKIKISELDITVYQDYKTGPFLAQPAVTLTPELEMSQAQRFAALFTVYRKNHAAITSVTFWGISDDRSWLNDQPVAGRGDFPLLWSGAHLPKAARAAIMNF